MSVATGPRFRFDNSFVRELDGLFEPWQPASVPAPELLVLNEPLARELDLDPDELRQPAGIAVLAGNSVPDGATPVAQAYAGHQFGGYSPRLGDGRALLLGEVVDIHGRRRDLHLKGSGRTPFARGGDGKAAVGPMLREYLIGEAMHALGIPTTRALAVVATGERIARETWLPGAVLSRVAASHLRVGSFQYAAAHGGPALVQRLADHAIARHQPHAATAPNPYLALLEGVVDVQASLVAQWMHVGFIHGVMNTDNTTISGETIDYGPCAFMDAYDPATVFSSIDHGGRYAYGNQPSVASWNLARFAETLLALLDDDEDRAIAVATDAVRSFAPRFGGYWSAGMRAKLGLTRDDPGDADLMNDLLALLQAQGVDHTSCYRALAADLRGDSLHTGVLFVGSDQWLAWRVRWHQRLRSEGRDPARVAQEMDSVNPLYIPRNHLVEEALAAASNDGDLAPFTALLDAVTHPFEERAGLERYTLPAPPELGRFVTFCGT